MNNSRFSPLTADLCLLGVTAIWGATFVTVKNALPYIPTFSFLAVRFLIAAVCLAAIYPSRVKALNRRTLRAGILIGVFLFAGYGFQTFGLVYTTASNAGFITGLSVVIVPMIMTVITRQMPAWPTTLGVISATTGLGLLSLGDTWQINVGDGLVLLCAFGFALHIVTVGRYAPNLDTVALAVVQIATVAVLSGLCATFFETWPERIAQNVWMAWLITAIPATSLAFLIQNTMQKFTTATRTAIVFSMEPVFSAIFAYYLAGEVLTMRSLVGCGLILLGMVLAEAKLPPLNKLLSSSTSSWLTAKNQHSDQYSK